MARPGNHSRRLLLPLRALQVSLSIARFSQPALTSPTAVSQRVAAARQAVNPSTAPGGLLGLETTPRNLTTTTTTTTPRSSLLHPTLPPPPIPTAMPATMAAAARTRRTTSNRTASSSSRRSPHMVVQLVISRRPARHLARATESCDELGGGLAMTAQGVCDWEWHGVRFMNTWKHWKCARHGTGYIMY
jgi:hypothetical protein